MNRLALFVLYTDLFAHQPSGSVPAPSGVEPTEATAKPAIVFARCSGING
jgi:hypothetical protein